MKEVLKSIENAFEDQRRLEWLLDNHVTNFTCRENIAGNFEDYNVAVTRSAIDFEMNRPRIDLPEPYFVSYDNPWTKHAPSKRLLPMFLSYEIQTIRHHTDSYGHVYAECYSGDDNPDPAGPVLYGVYGRFGNGLVDHIADFEFLVDAQILLQSMGVILSEINRLAV